MARPRLNWLPRPFIVDGSHLWVDLEAYINWRILYIPPHVCNVRRWILSSRKIAPTKIDIDLFVPCPPFFPHANSHKKCPTRSVWLVSATKMDALLVNVWSRWVIKSCVFLPNFIINSLLELGKNMKVWRAVSRRTKESVEMMHKE